MNHSRKLVEHGSYKILLGSNPKSDPESNQKEETREKQNMKKKRNTDFELDRKIFNFSREKNSRNYYMHYRLNMRHRSKHMFTRKGFK